MSKNNNKKISDCHYKKFKPSKILIYGSFYNEILLEDFDSPDCEYSKHFDIIRSDTIMDFDIVIIHFFEYINFMEKYIMVNPNDIPENKIMILFLMEPPASVESQVNFTQAKIYFHVLIASHHPKSYIHAPYCYYSKEKKKPDTFEYPIREFLNRKNAAAAIISNCYSSLTNRLEYVKMLNESYHVDGYGSCFDKKINITQHVEIYKKYKFILAFENSVCEGYVTEKYCNNLHFGSIPIVIATKYNENIMVKDSYINALNYQSTDDLARELVRIQEDFSLYSSFFKWRRHYKSTNRLFPQTCLFFEKIHKYPCSIFSDDRTYKVVGNQSSCISLDEQNKKLFKYIV